MSKRIMKIGLLDVIGMEQDRLLRFIAAHLATKYTNVIFDEKNYVYAVGKNPLCLLSHTDTLAMGKVRPVLSNNIVYNPDGILGADDRAGVFSILKILDLCDKNKVELPSVLFTSGEELGGIGMHEFIKSKKFDPNTVNLFLSLDRRHSNDYVYYSNDIPLNAKTYVKNGGFINNIGSYSDVKNISEKYMIAGVNLSIGYYLEHTDHEHLKIDEMLTTIRKVVSMIKNPIQEKQILTKDMVKVIRYEDWLLGDWTKLAEITNKYIPQKENLPDTKPYFPSKHYVKGTSYSNWWRHRISTQAVATTRD